MTTLARHLPILRWASGYQRTDLRGDLVAGFTTAVMLIPQGMAYAMLAGLPPVVGLYASIAPLAAYALFGTSRQLAVGPVAMVSLLVAAGVGSVAEPGTASFVAYAVLLALMVGLLQLGMGIGRLGFLTNFLSHPVVPGFTSAAAIIIGVSQLRHLLGVGLTNSHYVHEVLLEAVRRLEEVNPATVGIGLGSVALLLALGKLAPRFPRALLVVALGTLAVWAFDLHEAGVAILGEVPAGLPSPAAPLLDLAAARALLPTALAIALVSFMESISVAKAFARKNRYEVDSDQELIGLGLANLAGAAFGAYPVTGGFSRTAVNAQAGARTNLAGLVTAGVVAGALLLLTPLLHYLPKAVLAAIITSAVLGLVDLAEARHLWKVRKADLAMMGLTFAATLALGIEQGILLGVAASVVTFIARTSRPHVAVLGRLAGSGLYRNLARHPDARPEPGVVAVRIDAPVFFANTAYVKQALLQALEAREDARALVIDASGIGSVDAPACTLLEELREELARRRAALYVAAARGPVRDLLERAGFVERLGRDHLVERVADAVAAVHARHNHLVVAA